MRAEFINSFVRATGCKSAILREAYRRLTGDDSSSRTVDEESVDKRANEFLSLEDPKLIYDLRVNNKGQPEKYAKFLEVCQTYINSRVDTATDDRRHDSTSTNDNETTVVTHLATALSVRDLYDEVKKRVPEDCPIPSIQWLRLQFWTRKSTAATSKYFSGKLKLKFMVQSRQFRSYHVDVHYASALSGIKRNLRYVFVSSRNFFAWMISIHVKLVNRPPL